MLTASASCTNAIRHSPQIAQVGKKHVLVKGQGVMHRCLVMLLCSVLFMVRPLAHCNRLINWRLLRNFEILCGLYD